jgi:hypothetical protein
MPTAVDRRLGGFGPERVARSGCHRTDCGGHRGRFNVYPEARP